jgi:hypothetical protein
MLIMNRTSIMLPPDLRNRADQRCRQLGISFGELVRRALTDLLDRGGAGEVADSLLADEAVHRGAAPTDASARHDEYLYGRET